MTLADKLTSSRIILAPIFFIVFFYGSSLGLSDIILGVVLWGLFIVMELSDMLDGMAARSSKTVSAFGKLYDPFADVFARLSYFLCFTLIGIMPAFIFLIILYREFSQLFLRQLMAIKGIAMAARASGKIKAIIYAISAGLSLLMFTVPTFFNIDASPKIITWLAIGFNYIAGLAAVLSFADYIYQYRKINAAN